MAKKITKVRRGELQIAFLKYAMAAGERGIKYDDIIKKMEKEMIFNEHELSLNRSNGVRWKVFMAFGVIPLAKLGYVQRAKNQFWITEQGKKAVEMDPAVLRDELHRRWNEAKENEDNLESLEPETQVIANDADIFIDPSMYLNNERTVFKRVDYDLSALLHYIDIGDIGLPDIQRPFIWTAAKVRALFDSMYKGFPVGYLLFWSNAGVDGSRFIGIGERAHAIPHLLIVDGQQRLTSLFAVFRGASVVDNNYKEKAIEIAFRPRDGRFEVCDAAIRRDPEFVPNISELWSSNKSSWTLVNDFLKRLEAKRSLNEKQKEIISHNLDRLFDLQKYPFTALEISSSVEEEQVADIFVRINSEGVKLNQGDFILTLLSVFWDEGRKELEIFCRDARIPPQVGTSSPYNHFIAPDPDQLLRVEVAIGFSRGRLQTVYQLLRGKDLETGQISQEKRDEQFSILKGAQKHVLDLANWHGYFKCLIGAGFRSNELITSKICLMYCYAFYLIGKTRFKMSEDELQRLIGRFFFSATISNRYISSFESTIESDLNQIKNVSNKADFEKMLEEIISSTLTNDFWNITLPDSLDSSSANNSAYCAFLAAQNKLGAVVLFSKNRTIAEMLDPAIRSNRKTLEKHHLFPRAWLEEEGIDDLKMINQIANFALIDWDKNSNISDSSPREYAGIIKSQFDNDLWEKMCAAHALPQKWDQMAYDEFLTKRRLLMAQIIKKGFEAIR